MFLDILSDGLFAAVAAIGFGSISNVPVSAFKGCALLAALGHATRYTLMHLAQWNIMPAAFVAAIVVGLLAPKLGKYWNTPVEALAFPALLPMIPGMYAYRAVEGALLCLISKTEADFNHAFYLLNNNGMFA